MSKKFIVREFSRGKWSLQSISSVASAVGRTLYDSVFDASQTALSQDSNATVEVIISANDDRIPPALRKVTSALQHHVGIQAFHEYILSRAQLRAIGLSLEEISLLSTVVEPQFGAVLGLKISRNLPNEGDAVVVLKCTLAE